MKIRRILIPHASEYELGYIISQNFGGDLCCFEPINPNKIKRNRKFEYLPPDNLFLWSNEYHHYATFLSNKKLVLVDFHPDNYNTLRRWFKKITYANWVYWRLKLVGEVHSVIPSTELFESDDLVLPSGKENEIKFYSLKKSTIECILDKSEVSPKCTKEVKSIKELKKEIRDKVQLSIDLDFMRELSDSEINEIIHSLPQAYTIDFWLDKEQNKEDQYRVCLNILEQQIFYS